MEGENLEATINAGKDLIEKLESHEYLAIIEVNDEAQIISLFQTINFLSSEI